MYASAFVKLIVLLGPRKTALAKLERSHLYREEETAKGKTRLVPDGINPTIWITPHDLTKTKKTVQEERTYITPLPPLAQRILKALPAREDAPQLVFPGRHKAVALDPGTPLTDRLKALGAPADFHFHAIRHMIATWLQNEGHSEYERGLVLNHSGKGGVTDQYSHGYSLKLKRELLSAWADHVEKLVTPEGVVRLR